MRAEDYSERTVDDQRVGVPADQSYRLGDVYHCQADNVSPGARLDADDRRNKGRSGTQGSRAGDRDALEDRSVTPSERLKDRRHASARPC